MTLYRINLIGLHRSCGQTKDYSVAFVIAEDAQKAYDKVREYLDKQNYGFDGDRELKSIEPMADEEAYHGAAHRLYL